jgi:hypothetical protein
MTTEILPAASSVESGYSPTWLLSAVRAPEVRQFLKTSSAFVFRVLQLTHCHYLQLLTDPTIKSLAEEFLREFGDVDYVVYSADIVLNAKKPVA